MDANFIPRRFKASELDGGHVVALEVGPRREMLDRNRQLKKEPPRIEPGADIRHSESAEAPTEQKRGSIIVGAQMGDRDADNAVTPHYIELKRYLKRFCIGPYSSEVDEFALVLRVDGNIWYWNREGCDHIYRSKTRRYITIDIFVPTKRWEGVKGIEIRRYLAACVEEALWKLIDKLHRDKAPVDGTVLLKDFAVVKENYLPHVGIPASSEQTITT